MIRFARPEDIDILIDKDKKIDKQEMLNLINLNRVYIMEEDGKFIGWLRYNLFWDNTPFMNMIHLNDEDRGKGFGRKFVEFWEDEMRKLGYKTVLTSTASDEFAQHFYIKLGYSSIGGFLPIGKTFEIILSKKL
ncbi:MAG TPA: GNAT family N-acetyltransferase [Ruminococcaceae bacterium]|nr:GNAT family N-acetyltransferase [Oscillospiraceae bacterium]